MIDTYMRAVPNGLIWLSDEHDIQCGTQVRVRVTIPRKSSFHRKAFALLQTLHGYFLEHLLRQDQPAVPFETFRKWIVRQAGYSDMMPDGTLIPRSISYDKMDEEEFGRLYSDIIDFAVSDFLPAVVSREALEEQVETLVRGFA
jgi:hypothetical protein